MTVYKKGSKGETVRALQQALNVLGYPCGAADAIFGHKTKAAVQAFQAAQRLKEDGIVGKQTLAAFERALETVYPVPQTAHYRLDTLLVCRKGLERYWEDMPRLYYPNAQTLLERMEVLRTAVQAKYPETELVVRNGYRPPAYNKKVGGAKQSRHLYGQAVDLFCRTLMANRCPNCYSLGVVCVQLFNQDGGLGLGSNTNVHLDVRKQRTRWYYTYKSMSKWKDNQYE